MIADIGTIMWKEFKELLQQGGRFRGGAVGMLVFVGVFGVMLPLQTGRAWVTSPVSLVYWAWVPFLLVSSMVADVFAGERERHTLETLLASRLPDRAIFFGKLCAAIGYGWGLTLFGILLSLVTVNVAFGRGEILLYPALTLAGILILSFLVSLLAASLGVLVSLRAATVRQAQQAFSLAFFLLFVPMFLLPLLPASLTQRVMLFLQRANWTTILAALAAVLLVVDLILLALGLARFQRDRLILD